MVKNTLQETIKLVDQFKEKREILLELAPFHFNVLDEAGVNENSHSKIIGKILKYKDKGNFIHLNSFLKNVKLDLRIEHPRIFVEKGRLDISILDKSFALVIENKVHNAVDQDKQISNYVEFLKKQGYQINQIYVIYLTRLGFKIPTKNSLPQKLKNELGKRYKEVNFYSNILPWLTDHVLLSCKYKDKILVQGIEQYIDHLKGILNLRRKFKKMNQELKDFVSKELKLNDNDIKGNNEILEQKLKDINAYADSLYKLRIEIRNNLRKQFLELLFNKLKTEDSVWKCVNEINNEVTIQEANKQYFGFKNTSHSYKESGLFFSIEIQNWKTFLCGIFCRDNTLREEIKQKLKENQVELISNNSHWLYLNTKEYKYKSREPAYFVYDDEWNKFYIDDMEGMVNVFYVKIIEVFEGWKSICEKQSDIKE